MKYSKIHFWGPIRGYVMSAFIVTLLKMAQVKVPLLKLLHTVFSLYQIYAHELIVNVI